MHRLSAFSFLLLHYLYNSANELNRNSGWYETFFRGYDPAIGRFLQVDPLSFREQATYQYAANNPVMFSDANGAYASVSRTWKEQAEFLNASKSWFLCSNGRWRWRYAWEIRWAWVWVSLDG